MNKETVEHESSQPSQLARTEETINLQVSQKLEPGDIFEDGDRGVLDQVRDLLFGDQARDAEQRMQSVEERLATSIAQMRVEAQDHIETLRREMRERMDRIEERLSVQEAEWRGANHSNFQRMESIQAEMSEYLVKQTKDLAEQIKDGQQQTLAYVDSALGSLEKAKADRDALARLFSRLASQLEGED